MTISWTTVCLLVFSNVFMTFAWYGPLSRMKEASSLMLILISWGIALIEYCFLVPANRIGKEAGMDLNQLKIIQEAISLSVFLPVSCLFLGNHFSWNYVAAAACIIAAVFFVFCCGGKPA